MQDPFTREVVRRALDRVGKDLGGAVSVPTHSDPYTHTLAVAYGAKPLEPTWQSPLLAEAVAIAQGVVERNIRKQIMCAAYRRLLLMPDTLLTLHFPGTRTQRDQWVRRGVLRLSAKASPELLQKLNSYGRRRGDL